MQLNEKQNADVFVIFIAPKAQEAKCFINGRVIEWRQSRALIFQKKLYTSVVLVCDQTVLHFILSETSILQRIENVQFYDNCICCSRL